MWCATETGPNDMYVGQWGVCDLETCKGIVASFVLRKLYKSLLEKRPMRCYTKLSFEDTEPDLRYCRYEHDICVYSYLKYEDGLHHSSQYCSSSDVETWWLGDKTPCVYGNQGGYQCGCSQTG